MNRLMMLAMTLAVLGLFGCSDNSSGDNSVNDGDDPQAKSIVVTHTADFPAGVGYLEYLVLSDDGEWLPLEVEFGLNDRDVIEVPKNTQVLRVRAHSDAHDVLEERFYLVSAANEAAAPASYSRWMTQNERIQTSTLSKMTIPGAHDAGMGMVASCSTYASSDSTQTQYTSIWQMLNDGIRYFDLRPIFVQGHGVMRLGHYSWIGKTINLGVHKFTLRNEGCAGFAVETALEHVRAFMEGSENREVVILKMSHFMNLQTHDNSSSQFDPADFAQLQRMIQEKLGPYLLIGNRDFRYTPISALTATGPKVIVTFDAQGYDGSSGIYPESDLNLYDQYANKSSYTAMRDDQFDKLKTYARSVTFEKVLKSTCKGMVGPMSAECMKNMDAVVEALIRINPYFVLSWTLTQSESQMIACSVAVTPELRWIAAQMGYECKTLQDLGKEANSHLGDAVAQAKKIGSQPHVLYVDNAGESATSAAIAINAMD